MIARTKHIPDGKSQLKTLPITEYMDADLLYYPVTSQRCPEGETCVIGGQYVKIGEVIGTRKGAFFEQNMHATVSGEVVGFEKHVDQSGKPVDCLIVRNDFKNEVHPSIKERTDAEIDAMSREDIIDIVKDAGLVGLGGGAFPSYIKMQTKDTVNVVVANGVECEPMLISDYGLMMEKPREILQGLVYAMKGTGAPKGVIAIKKKYKELYEHLMFARHEFCGHDIEVVRVGNHYPQGWEIETVKHATGITIPQGDIPSKHGVVIYNVSTLSSIYNAVKKGLPVLERYITLSGEGVKNRTFRARIGTMMTELVKKAGGYVDPETPKVLILGGPMMGTNVTRDDIVMTHTTTSLIVQNDVAYNEEPCVRCASCVYSCPVSIQPVQIMNAYKARNKDALKTLKVDTCIECGLCTYVCPSKIHLTEYMRLGKRLAK
jgi:Na+-translocating ferredoxin:NAD+ oxidoreductase subunit C